MVALYLEKKQICMVRVNIFIGPDGLDKAQAMMVSIAEQIAAGNLKADDVYTKRDKMLEDMGYSAPSGGSKVMKAMKSKRQDVKAMKSKKQGVKAMKQRSVKVKAAGKTDKAKETGNTKVTAPAGVKLQATKAMKAMKAGKATATAPVEEATKVTKAMKAMKALNDADEDRGQLDICFFRTCVCGSVWSVGLGSNNILWSKPLRLWVSALELHPWAASETKSEAMLCQSIPHPECQHQPSCPHATHNHPQHRSHCDSSGFRERGGSHEEACCREGEVHDDRLAAGLVLGPTCNVVAVYNTASGVPT